MASLVVTDEASSQPQPGPKPEFRTPLAVNKCRLGHARSTPQSSPLSVTSRESMNFVEVLSDARASRTLSEKYRLILASIKFISTGVRPPVLIPSVQLLTELSKMTTLLDGYNEMLVNELFKCRLLSLELDVLSAYIQFLVELARSNTFHHEDVCRQLLGAMASIDEDDAPQAQLDLAHDALRRMIKELPHFQEALLKQTSKCLPFMTRPWRQQVHMYRQMLRIVDYATPQLSLEVLSRLVHKIIDLDCHCPKEEMLAADETAAMSTQFPMEEATAAAAAEDEAGGLKTHASSCEEQLPPKSAAEVAPAAALPPPPPPDKEMKHALGNTFDRLMELFFEYIDAHTTNVDDAKVTYRRLLAVFDRYIMATYRCLHIQFLMFYICSKRPLFADHLIDFLWHKVQNPNTSVLFRQIAVAYLGSLLSRALYVPIGTVKDTLLLLSRFLHSYLAQISSAHSLGVDVNRHGTFYTVCQSLFYCIAFRHKDLVDSVGGLDFLRSLNLEQLVTSPLNPLKVISRPIVMNFANVSRHYQVVYCHAIIERNQRSALPMAQAQSSIGVCHMQASGQHNGILESYFPFDPYALLRSRRWIAPIYRSYVDHLATENDDEDIDIDDDDFEGEAEIEADDMAVESGHGDEVEKTHNGSTSAPKKMAVGKKRGRQPGAARSSSSSQPQDVAMSTTPISGSHAEKLFAYSVSPGFAH